MKINIASDHVKLGEAAGHTASRLIREAIEQNGTANVILATGTSQFETLKHVIAQNDIDWGKVVMFHLDEYIGLPVTHPASFRKYLKERFLSKVPALNSVDLINGETNAEVECIWLGDLITQYPIDVAFVGIVEHGNVDFTHTQADS